jgi:hypothetical protein
MYHPDAFTTLEEAFDPLVNAAYAGRLLNALHAVGKESEAAIWGRTRDPIAAALSLPAIDSFGGRKNSVQSLTLKRA